jgi:dynein heavy chain
MLTPVLEKQVISKAKSKYINVSDKLCEYNEAFVMYLTTRLPNPTFSPEDQAQCTLVDFTVTQQGLEEQLGKVRGLDEQVFVGICTIARWLDRHLDQGKQSART